MPIDIHAGGGHSDYTVLCDSVIAAFSQLCFSDGNKLPSLKHFITIAEAIICHS